jgi:DNA-binding MarR family transcriptional regulator
MPKKIEEVIQQQKPFTSKHQKATIGLLIATTQMRNMMAEHLKSFGITGPQFNVLRILRGSFPKPLTIFMIRNRMVEEQSDVSRIVARLVQQGLATSCIQENNKRACDVSISESGLALLKKIDPLIADMKLADLNEDELDMLIGLLERMIK